VQKYSYLLFFGLLSSFCSAEEAVSLADRQIQSLYDGAEEMEMLNQSMEKGMKLHNKKATPRVIETTEERVEGIPLEGFKEEGNRYLFEELIDDANNTDVNVTVNGYSVSIVTKTTHKEENFHENGMRIITSSSSSQMELTLPFTADMSTLTKTYNDGLLKISVDKKRKFGE